MNEVGQNSGENTADPITIPDLDDPKEQEKIRKESSKQSENNEAQRKLELIEERLKAMEGSDVYGMVDVYKMSLVPDLVLPSKFNVPTFDKYDGTKCPSAHLYMYCKKMTGYTSNDKLLIHCFQDSLSGSAIRWYNFLSRDQIKSWTNFAKAFLVQYKHMTDTAPDRMSLQNMEKKTNETFREYTHKWRDLAAQVQPPMIDKELNKMFLNTLKAPYYDRMIGNSDKHFSNVISVGEMIEAGVKQGKIEASKAKKQIPKRKEGETHVVTYQGKAYNLSYPPQQNYGYHPYNQYDGNATQRNYQSNSKSMARFSTLPPPV